MMLQASNDTAATDASNLANGDRRPSNVRKD
jgi:hypothetical protein